MSVFIFIACIGLCISNKSPYLDSNYFASFSLCIMYCYNQYNYNVVCDPDWDKQLEVGWTVG